MALKMRTSIREDQARQPQSANVAKTDERQDVLAIAERLEACLQDPENVEIGTFARLVERLHQELALLPAEILARAELDAPVEADLDVCDDLHEFLSSPMPASELSLMEVDTLGSTLAMLA